MQLALYLFGGDTLALELPQHQETTTMPTNVRRPAALARRYDRIHDAIVRRWLAWRDPFRHVPTFTRADRGLVQLALETHERMMLERGNHAAAQRAHDLRDKLAAPILSEAAIDRLLEDLRA